MARAVIACFSAMAVSIFSTAARSRSNAPSSRCRSTSAAMMAGSRRTAADVAHTGRVERSRRDDRVGQRPPLRYVWQQYRAHSSRRTVDAQGPAAMTAAHEPGAQRVASGLLLFRAAKDLFVASRP